MSCEERVWLCQTTFFILFWIRRIHSKTRSYPIHLSHYRRLYQHHQLPAVTLKPCAEVTIKVLKQVKWSVTKNFYTILRNSSIEIIMLLARRELRYIYISQAPFDIITILTNNTFLNPRNHVIIPQ